MSRTPPPLIAPCQPPVCLLPPGSCPFWALPVNGFQSMQASCLALPLSIVFARLPMWGRVSALLRFMADACSLPWMDHSLLILWGCCGPVAFPEHPGVSLGSSHHSTLSPRLSVLKNVDSNVTSRPQ